MFYVWKKSEEITRFGAVPVSNQQPKGSQNDQGFATPEGKTKVFRKKETKGNVLEVFKIMHGMKETEGENLTKC